MHLIDQIRAIERRYATLRGPLTAGVSLRSAEALHADALRAEGTEGAEAVKVAEDAEQSVTAVKTGEVAEVAERLAVASAALGRSELEDAIPTGWSAVDEALQGGLPRGGLHEFFGVAAWPVERAAEGSPAGPAARPRPLGSREPRGWRFGPSARGSPEPPRGDGTWLAPLAIAAHLAWQALDRADRDRWILWIGRISRPFPRLLARDQGRDPRLLQRSIFVDPPSAAARLWAIDLALRCAAVEGVVADGSGFDLPATQRLQHLARTRRTWALLLRPPPERVRLSAAHSRWQVFWRPREDASPQAGWILRLLRCKGVHGEPGPRSWALEWSHAEGVVHLSAALADSAGAARIAAALPRYARPAAGVLGDSADRVAARRAARAVCV